MKRKNVLRVLATAFAVTLIVASPMASIESHALGFNADAHDTDENRGSGNVEDAGYWDCFNESSDSGSSDSSSSYEEPTSGSSNNSSYADNSSSSDNGSYADNSSSSDSGSSASVATPTNIPNSKTLNVDGGQKFRITMNAEHTVYHIYHCGISRVSFKVTNADGNAVAFNSVTLEKGTDGLWYAVVNFAQGVDTTGLTVTASTGDATYLSTTLGVSGIKIGGEVVLSTVPTAAVPATEAN